MLTTKTVRSLIVALACLAGTETALAQRVLDRVDPTRVEDTAPREGKAVTNAPVVVRQAPTTSADATPIASVGAVIVTGLTTLRQQDFTDIVMPYLGRSLSAAELAALADAIAVRARSRGYVFADARIPAQAVTAGVLRVALDEGRIDAVRLTGAQNRAVADALSPLVTGRPVTLAELERRLLVAGDIDGLYLSKPKLLREGGRNVLEVGVTLDRFGATIGLDNFGSRPIGPLQGDVVARAAQLLADDDLLTLVALATPTQPDEFGFARLRYAKRVSRAGTELSLSGSRARTRPGAYLLSRDIQGSSWTASTSLLHPLLRRRATSLWLDASFGIRTVEQDRAGVRARRDRLSVGRVGVYGFTEVGGGRLRTSATLSQGFDILGATRRGDPLASRADADGTFTTLAMTAEWSRQLDRAFSLHLGAATQIAAQPLLVSEEVGLGGGQFLRGYDYSERNGDEGTMGSAEMRWAPVPKVGPIKDPVLYAFVDGGRVTNRRGGFGSGTLFSAGGGVRGDVLSLLSADVGVAVPLSGPRYDSGHAKPVINFRLVRRF